MDGMDRKGIAVVFVEMGGDLVPYPIRCDSFSCGSSDGSRESGSPAVQGDKLSISIDGELDWEALTTALVVIERGAGYMRRKVAEKLGRSYGSGDFPSRRVRTFTPLGYHNEPLCDPIPIEDCDDGCDYDPVVFPDGRAFAAGDGGFIAVGGSLECHSASSRDR